MQEFLVFEEHPIVDFRLYDQSNKREVVLYINKEINFWDFKVFYDRWFYFRLENGCFIDRFENRLTKKELKKINNEFYELLKQIKNHPDYRLKMLNMLNDEIRKVWNAV